MPLLNKRLLTRQIQKHRHAFSSQKKQELKDLFKQTLTRIESKKFKKEESEKVPFLQKMFELLGYKLHENLEFEFSTQGRSIYGVLGEQTENTRNVEVAIEWKGIDTKSLDKGKAGETPVSQMWDYMGKTNTNFGIVGNFLEWRLYIKQKGQTEYHQFNLRELSEQEDKLDEMIFLLKKSMLLRGNSKTSGLEDLLHQNEVEQAEITKRFYNDYKDLRGELFEHLVENNEQIINNNEELGNTPSSTTTLLLEKGEWKHLLLEKTQKVLDRMIFVMFCEDNQLLPMYTVKNTYEQAMSRFSRSETKVWDEFLGLFDGIDKGFPAQNIPAYNGGLFAPDPKLEKLVLKDEIFTGFVKLAEYFFDSDLDVNILGHIFEQSISDIEEMKAELEGEATDKKKSKRKKDGIYYTPSYITDYIVRETVGNYLQDNSDKLEQIKILDPAGGSGAFPNQAHNYLVKKTVETQTQEAISDGFENFVPDERTIDKGILNNNIFMVDLQPESVEIAKLSLWLKTARKDQKLDNLDDNVKCGNSLIDEPEIAGERAFDWHKEFEEIMASGGFDVVVGNPPYGGEITKQQQEYYIKNYKTAHYKLDTYGLFVEKAIKLLSDGGYLSFIMPYTWLTIQQHRKLRELLLTYQIVEIVDLPTKVFEDADLDTVILILKKAEPKEKISIAEIVDGTIKKTKTISVANIHKNEDLLINIHLSNEDIKLLGTIKTHSDKLNEFCEVSQGLIPYDKYRGHDEYTIKNRIWHAEEKKDDTFKPEIQGKEIGRYSIDWTGKTFISYGDWLAAPREPKFFQSPRILIMEVTRGEEHKIKAVYTKKEYYNTPSIINIIHPENNTIFLKFILGIINSKLITWYHTKVHPKANATTSIPKILVNDVRNIPIPKATADQQAEIAELVDRIMELKATSQKLVNSFTTLVKTKYEPSTLSKKLQNWPQLESDELLYELKKQKATITLSDQAELLEYFEVEKTKVLELEKQVEVVDTEIEGLVRVLYGVEGNVN